jgi:hypothetical protein
MTLNQFLTDYTEAGKTEATRFVDVAARATGAGPSHEARVMILAQLREANLVDAPGTIVFKSLKIGPAGIARIIGGPAIPVE